MTPTLLIDGLAENMNLRLQELPVSGLSRTLTVVARKEELQTLPDAIAQLCKQTLARQIEGHMGGIGVKCVEYDSA